MNCDRCDNTVAYSRKYSGENLCSDCFSISILRKTAKTISKYKMIKNGDVVCVAVSGGKDSLALLHILDKMSKTQHFQIKVITIDEGISGYRNEALGIVKSFCSRLQLEFKVFSYKELFDLTIDNALRIRENEKTTSCSICGTLRRRAIDYAAKEVGANVIATAHNLDDTLQTFLINLMSGNTTKIAWMNPDTSEKIIRKIKPFCEIYESEIVFYVFINDIPFQTEPCPYMNEGIRTEIREFLNSLETQHAGIKNNLYNSVLRTSQHLKIVSFKETNVCKNCRNECTSEICSVCKIVLKLKESQ